MAVRCEPAVREVGSDVTRHRVGDRVGVGSRGAVVGLGGLGYMAVEIAHALGSEVEVIAVDQVNEAYGRVLASDVRYRFVIDASTLG